jgi:hypothetical protein
MVHVTCMAAAAEVVVVVVVVNCVKTTSSVYHTLSRRSLIEEKLRVQHFQYGDLFPIQC